MNRKVAFVKTDRMRDHSHYISMHNDNKYMYGRLCEGKKTLRPPAPPFTAIFIYVQNPSKRHVSLYLYSTICSVSNSPRV